MKPILFNTDKVRAILDSRKTVTRRVVKYTAHDIYKSACANGLWYQTYDPKNPPKFLVEWYVKTISKPRYQPGDILYVRETWQEKRGGWYLYKADTVNSFDLFITPDGCVVNEIPWHPSIHMPKEAARIFLRVTDLQAKLLHQIKNEDVLREGISPKGLRPEGCKCSWAVDGCLEMPCGNRDAYVRMCHVKPFAEAWDGTIKLADRALYGWAANPWVWVIEFERIGEAEAIRSDLPKTIGRGGGVH